MKSKIILEQKSVRFVKILLMLIVEGLIPGVKGGMEGLIPGVKGGN
jgi:hypothetical protein